MGDTLQIDKNAEKINKKKQVAPNRAAQLAYRVLS